MTAENYYKNVNSHVQSLFDGSISQNKELLSLGIDISKSLQIWHLILPDDDYKILISNSIQSLEVSLLSQTYCLYRSAFSSLRLSMEMLFGAVYFSANKLEFIEWTKSSNDLNWSTITDTNNGVLSYRFCNAFFPEMGVDAQLYQTKSKELYRKLSEHVHGNYHTWNKQTDILQIEPNFIKIFEGFLKLFREISTLVLCVRFLKQLKRIQLEQIESIILQELNHVSPINHFLSNSE